MALAILVISVTVALAVVDIPYVKQKPNMCGAACLSMAYKSFGEDYTQDEIFEFTATPCIVDGKNRPTNPIYKMAQDPLNRGYHAIAIQAKDPMVFFQLFSTIKDRIRVIVSMVPGVGVHGSHLMLLIDANEKDLVFHDPDKCPSYHLTREKFIKKWVSFGLIAISKDAPKAYSCPVCGGSVPDNVTCPKCDKSIPLEPKEVLGCVNDECSGKMWTLLFCPYCSMNINGIQDGKAKSPYRKKKIKKKEILA
ncbi:MAG: C39 family peptidase [Candidatus Omnitrophica bacterium]|nr:C39 family peptidase [Candidatus Omnitrophota bacterium]